MRSILYSILVCCLSQFASAQCTPIITPQGSTTFCDGDDVTLSGSLGDTYQWYLNGNAITGANSDTYIATTAGDYTVEIDSVGCIATSAPVTVTVNTVPAQPGMITISDDTVCSGSSVTFSIDTVPGADSYEWSVLCNTPVFQTTTAASLTTAVGAGQVSTPNTGYMVSAVNSCGSSSSSNGSFAIYSPVYTQGMNNDPDITYASNEVFICPNDPNNELNAFSHWAYVGYSGTPTSYQWYRNNVPLPGATGYSYYIQKGGSYKVVITTGNVCQATIQKVPIHQVVPIPTSIDVLTPNEICDGGVALLKVNFDMDGYDGTSCNWWWTRNDTSVTNPFLNVQTLVTSFPGAYSVGLWGYGYMNNIMQCPAFPVLANISLSQDQATPVSITQSGNILYADPGFAAYQWCRNNIPIAGATNDNFTINNWGDFSVVATDNNGCASQSNVVVGVESLSVEKNGIHIYPNPNNGEINLSVNIPGENRMALIEVLDIAGKVLYADEQNTGSGKIESQIHLENIAPGLYFLKVRSGSVNTTVSFVKQ